MRLFFVLLTAAFAGIAGAAETPTPVPAKAAAAVTPTAKASPETTPRKFFYEPGPIIDAWVTKAGGLEAWKKVKTVRAVSTVTLYRGEVAAQTNRMELLVDRSGKTPTVKVTVQEGPRRVVSLKKGGVYRRYLNGDLQDKPADQTEGRYQTETQWFWFALPFGLKDGGYEFGYPGFHKAPERLTHMVTATAKGDAAGAVADLFTFYIVESQTVPMGAQFSRKGEEAVQVGFDGWEQFGPIFRERVRDVYDKRGKKVLSQRIETIDWNPKLTAKDFEP